MCEKDGLESLEWVVLNLLEWNKGVPQKYHNTIRIVGSIRTGSVQMNLSVVLKFANYSSPELPSCLIVSPLFNYRPFPI
jgi:hypothetical protein